MKIYKRILKSFGGAAIYLDKTILSALEVKPGDEIVLDIQKDKVVITKPLIDPKIVDTILKIKD